MTIKAPTPEQVTSLRAEFEMTAADFGEIVYAEGATVYAWESGRRQCPVLTWEVLMVYFGKAEPRRLHIADTPATVAVKAKAMRRAMATMQKAIAQLPE